MNKLPSLFSHTITHQIVFLSKVFVNASHLPSRSMSSHKPKAAKEYGCHNAVINEKARAYNKGFHE